MTILTIILATTIGTVLGLAWVLAGVLGPIVTCAKTKFEAEDFLMIPFAALFGPLGLGVFLLSYVQAKRRMAR